MERIMFITGQNTPLYPDKSTGKNDKYATSKLPALSPVAVVA